MKKLHTWICRCGDKYSVRATDPDLELLPERIKCLRPWCRYYLRQYDEVAPGPAVRAVDLFRMMSSMGSPSERKCAPAELKKKLVGKKIVGLSLKASPADKDRSFIDSFTLEGGVTVHLGMSTKGVTIYKVSHE